MFGGFIAVFKTMYSVCNDNRVVDTIIPESYDVFFYHLSYHLKIYN